jgi:hypothetical protein
VDEGDNREEPQDSDDMDAAEALLSVAGGAGQAAAVAAEEVQEVRKKTKYCNCNKGCTNGKCGCVSAGEKCGPGCHKKSKQGSTCDNCGDSAQGDHWQASERVVGGKKRKLPEDEWPEGLGASTEQKRGRKLSYNRALQVAHLKYACFHGEKNVRASILQHLRASDEDLRGKTDEEVVKAQSSAFQAAWVFLDALLPLAVEPFLGYYTGESVSVYLTIARYSYLT